MGRCRKVTTGRDAYMYFAIHIGTFSLDAASIHKGQAGSMLNPEGDCSRRHGVFWGSRLARGLWRHLKRC